MLIKMSSVIFNSQTFNNTFLKGIKVLHLFTKVFWWNNAVFILKSKIEPKSPFLSLAHTHLCKSQTTKITLTRGFPVAQMVKNPPAMWETCV